MTITETKFADLKAKLRELFELDKSDLDFGIYRIMAAKNKEVTEFLDRQLKDVVREKLAEHGAGAADSVQAELDKTIAALQQLSAPVDTNPTVIALRARLAAAGGAAAGDLEADIYNHLLAFFSRYYDEGDFISKRRYKGDTYAIPYAGEEVTLYWANKDQYYVKSGEWHKDYRFKIGNKTVRFQLVGATAETNNNKEPDDAKRRYILAAERPVEAADGELTLRFEFRVPSEAEKARAAAGAVAIFGGKYASSTKGDEREQFCADAEKRTVAAIPDAWQPLVGSPSPTETKPARTLLGKHLDTFTARNTFDYFIHKDLGGFLGRELDFYIKNEVVRLDDLEKLPADHLARVQSKVKAIRAVAGRIIQFLASIENFQKKMWLKKKLVLNTNWLVTIDRIPDKLRDVVAANQEQWKEWERLGFKPSDEDAALLGAAKWGTREYLDANDKLVVDTRVFECQFKGEILAEQAARSPTQAFDDTMLGLLVHSENSSALAALASSCRSRVQSVFIDPPYNTGVDGFPYKDAYQHSSWMAMMEERLAAVAPLLSQFGVLFATIDYVEVSLLRLLCDSLFGMENFLADVAWEKRYTRSNNAKRFYSLKDTVLCYRATSQLEILRELRSEKSKENYSNPDNDARGPWISSSYVNPATRDERPNLVYEIRNPFSGATVVHPTHAWKYDRETNTEHIEDNRLYWGTDGGYELPRLKSFLSEASDGMVPIDVWSYKETGTTDDGGNLLKSLFGKAVFDNPKPTALVRRALSLTAGGGDATTLDFFGGSGTTAHAVIEMNREGTSNRKFITVEMAEYFETVVRPRVAKALYSPDWKDGRAQTHGKGVSALVKYFTLESYEDALNNLPAPSGELLAGADAATKDALIAYSLDLEMGPNLLNLEMFRDPWGYSINAQPAGEAEIRRHRVDLVETFNYLLGLKVASYGPMERYSAEFVRAPHADGLGRVKVDGRLRRDAAGPYVFHRVEGELNDGNATRVLVIWRKLTDDPEQDAAVLDAWMARHREDTRQRTEHRDYHLIYVNGPVTLPQPTAEIRTVFPIEETFKDRMFADTEGA